MSNNTLPENNSSEKLVMIVDDEPDMLSMLRLVLEKRCQCTVRTAESGLDALHQLDTYHPDVVVTDIKMPDLNGLELLKRIKKVNSPT
mgnify:CR=1 FL=1